MAVVADLENETSPLFPQVLALIDHLILSEEFALRLTGAAHPAQAAQALWNSDRAVVIVTCGADGCWSMAADHGSVPQPHPAFVVKALDTTGCGDVFHGAYAASLAAGSTLEERIRVASAAAALKASQGEIPDRAAVEALLRAHA